MNTTDFDQNALILGHGPRTLEVFLEPTCPFSVRAFRKLETLIDTAGEQNLTIKLRIQSQPWHMYSGVIVRCIFAAATLEDARNSVLKVLTAVADHREEFEFDDHCTGENMDVTPRELIQKIEQYSGLSLADAFKKPTVTQQVKWHCKYARQNGIHVSPTFMIDGLVVPDMGSGETIDEWMTRLQISN